MLSTKDDITKIKFIQILFMRQNLSVIMDRRIVIRSNNQIYYDKEA